jgi:hypothetical protein
LGLGFALSFVVSQSNCGFPDYAFGGAASAGGGGVGNVGGGGIGSAGAGGTSGGVPGGAPSGGAFDGGSGGLGAAGDSGAAGTAGSNCISPAPVGYPDHCFDAAKTADETDVDCGGADCIPCVASPVMSLQYTSIVTDAFPSAPKFRLLLTYLASTTVSLSRIKIRYYFNHNDVAEPVVSLDTQAMLDPGNSPMNIAPNTTWTIHRFPPGPPDNANRTTDSYLEIAFSSQTFLVNGTKLDLTQDIVSGIGDSKFEQASHYSYRQVSGLSPNPAITVYRSDERILGVEPPMNVLPDCAFALGVNLNGPELTVGGQVLDGSGGQGAQVTYAGTPYSSATSKPLPATDSATAKMLSSAFLLTSSVGATWAVPDGSYWAYAWLTSAASADSGTLSIQGTPADKFYGTQQSTASAWALLGPYRIDVTDNTLWLTATGRVNVAGLKLYVAQ